MNKAILMATVSGMILFMSQDVHAFSINNVLVQDVKPAGLSFVADKPSLEIEYNHEDEGVEIESAEVEEPEVEGLEVDEPEVEEPEVEEPEVEEPEVEEPEIEEPEVEEPEIEEPDIEEYDND